MNEKKGKVLLLDLSQQTIGQLQAGVLLPTKSSISFYVFGRYNFDFVPNKISRSSYFLWPTIQYSEEYAKESGYTVGVQVRQSVTGRDQEYEQYLKRKRARLQGYRGGWIEIGNSKSASSPDPFRYSITEASVPKSTLTWSTISAGVLAGYTVDIGNSFILDTHTGLGLRRLRAKRTQPEYGIDLASESVRYNGVTQTENMEFATLAPRLGVQVGYRF